jgi:hypothetical protein
MFKYDVMFSTNTSGIRGVWLDKRNGRWGASIWVNNKTKHLGKFDTKEEAAEVRKQAEQKYFCK